MDEKRLEARKHFASEEKPSMKRRDDYNDYRDRRMYMITMEVEGRRPLFGQLAGEPDAPDDSPDAPRIILSPLGQGVHDEWFGIPRYYPQIEVMALQMMPDHLHGILFVHEALPVHLSQVLTGFKTGCNRLYKAALQAATESPIHSAATEPPVHSAATERPPTPNRSSVQAAAPSQRGVRLFAPGYNDLLLKTYDEFQTWKNYLLENPRRLLIKRESPEFLRPFFGLSLGTHVYSGIGNRALLAAPRRLTVRVSRRLTAQDIEREKARYLALAQEGTVLISPAISPGEKQVMRAAFDAGLPTIVIMENGFTPLSKPKGEQFYACAAGRLLMLSPWEHHNERRPLTAYQCQQMNLMAQELAEPLTQIKPSQHSSLNPLTPKYTHP